MTESKAATLGSLQIEGIQELVQPPGPCVTVLLAPYRPGEQAKPRAGVIKNYLKDAARMLAQRQVPASIRADLLDPIEHLSEDPELFEGSHWGRAIFRSPGVFQQFELLGPVQGMITVGGYFAIRPILADLLMPREFYVLKLSKKNVGLMKCSGLKGESVSLPKGVPETLDEATSFEPPDHDLENRSSAGSSIGSMRSVRFGTGAGRETQQVYLSDFYKAVDRGIREVLKTGDVPLVLAGVDEDKALYRTNNRYPNLLAQSIPGSPEGSWAEPELLYRAYTIVRSDCTERSARALAEARERVAPVRYANGLNAILRAAVEGRVASLYIDEAAQMHGVFEGAKRGGRWNYGDEDLLNAAAVETILRAGEAFSLPAGRIPGGEPAAAILRF